MLKSGGNARGGAPGPGDGRRLSWPQQHAVLLGVNVPGRAGSRSASWAEA